MRPWWRDAVTYQIYIRSFADSNGDGKGDVEGIRSRLPYLKRLGIDAIWITPWYPSPQKDHGYDVSDYMDIEPDYGTLKDAEVLIKEAHAMGIRVIVDIVPNHSSDQHVWFQEALRAKPGSKERDRYMFRDGKGANGEIPPNNWQAVFGGPAWQRVTEADGKPGQWYLHLFAVEQPDFNWENPEVHEYFEKTLRFWLDRGVDGFRIDVAHGMVKAPGLPDVLDKDDATPEMLAAQRMPFWDQEGVHEIYRKWRKIFDSYEGDRMAVAEAWVSPASRIALYLRKDELANSFNFDFLTSKWEIKDLKAYIYQGEELALPEVRDIPEHRLEDPRWNMSNNLDKGRDGCRVPLPWRSSSNSAFGFSGTASVTPEEAWLPQPNWWGDYSVESQDKDPASTLNMYRTALEIRHKEAGLGDGAMEWVDFGPDVLAFRRAGNFLCLVNFGGEIKLPEGELLVSSSPIRNFTLSPDTAVWMRTK
ncbi:MAG: hypothetical protein EB112_04010 [Actinobacteria bacterium]|nr:hypothetical protein [Actinomycetota bacterium]